MSILLSGDAHQHVLFEDEAKALQLAVSGASLLEPARLTSTILWAPADVKRSLTGIACLNGLRSSGRLADRFFPPEPRGPRLRSVLRAFDGFVAGASHREIGVVLFGQARVDHDWADPRDHLRDTVRRAIGRGRLLVNGGYRQFMR
ncbi:DUF2285 domain-containing protein [Mesorhizobium sp. B4-1-3]|uniref:DUF2285 domain-containing protein n=1 Tax=Mesorhizobium sp. B4-1-3 TaxID=2589889 RepID=UPI001FED9DD9|nr:DUF2285 domain-containing protein [Mesorhizobium sp. B4-1-3]